MGKSGWTISGEKVRTSSSYLWRIRVNSFNEGGLWKVSHFRKECIKICRGKTVKPRFSEARVAIVTHVWSNSRERSTIIITQIYDGK